MPARPGPRLQPWRLTATWTGPRSSGRIARLVESGWLTLDKRVRATTLLLAKIAGRSALPRVLARSATRAGVVPMLRVRGSSLATFQWGRGAPLCTIEGLGRSYEGRLLQRRRCYTRGARDRTMVALGEELRPILERIDGSKGERLAMRHSPAFGLALRVDGATLV